MTTPTPFFDLEPYLYDPARQAVAVLEWARRAKQPGYRLTTFGIADMDETVTLFPGSLTAVAGRPGHGKSQLLKHLAARAVDEIRAEGSDECVVFVTLEESVEMIAATVNGLGISSRDVHRGRFDLAALEADVHALIPRNGLMVLAHPGIVGTGKNRRLADPLTSRRILDAISRIEVTTTPARRPRLVLLDYLQLLQPDRDGRHSEATKVAEVMAAVEGAKGIAAATGAAVVIAVQASREADTRRPPMPQLADMQWASAIEQACDTVLGALRPIRHPLYDQDDASGERPDFQHKGRNYPVTDDLAVFGIVKQRHGEGYGTFVASMDPKTSRLSEHPWSMPIVHNATRFVDRAVAS